MPVEVLPLVGAVTTGVCLSAYALRHHAVYNPDISTKSRTTYGWERFESAQKIEPRLHFLEGTKANNKARAFVEGEVAKGRIFAGSPESFLETSLRQ